ncbi:MAG: hypothetical protein ABR548_14035 [Actinomycetota bacterium]
MVLHQPEQERLIAGETLRGIEREVRDLVLSLRALTALLRSEPAAEHEDPVLVRILDAELNQLAVLVGEVCTALRVEDHGTHSRSLDLSRALHQAARRVNVRALVKLGAPVPVSGDPEIVSQIIQSALAIAVRLADGRVTAEAEERMGGGVVLVKVPRDADQVTTRKRDARMVLLRRLMSAQGGRFTIERQGNEIHMKLWFPKPASKLRRVGSA